MSWIRFAIVAVWFVQATGLASASERHVTEPKDTALQENQQPEERTSRQKIIDAAQVYCTGGTPFDRVHALLDQFWESSKERSDDRRIFCKDY
ncbi:MAG: hypothetical protein AAF557_02000 [Pseudomonadota bacterium]